MLRVSMMVQSEPRMIEAALEGLTAQNVALMSESGVGSAYPDLYATGVVYRREPRGSEAWKPADELLADGFGDCEDLSGYVAGWYRNRGEPARVKVETTKIGSYHAVVERGDGSIEDPSRILLRKERSMVQQKPKICIREVGSHVLGTIEIPMADGSRLVSSELGFNPIGALRKALRKVYDTVRAHPEIVALVSPQAALALQVASKISEMSPEALKQLVSDERSTDAQKALATKILEEKGAAGPATATASAVPVSFWASTSLADVIGAEPGQRGAGDRAPREGVYTQGSGRPTTKRETIVDMRKGSPTYGQDIKPWRTMTDEEHAKVVRVISKTKGKPAPSTGPGTRDPATGRVWNGVRWADTSDVPPGTVDPVTLRTWDGARWVDPAPPVDPAGNPLPQPPIAPGMPPGVIYPTAPPVQPGQGQWPGTMPPPYYPPQYPYPPQTQYPYPYPYPAPPMYPYPYPYPYGPQEMPEPLSAEEAAAIATWGAETFAEGAFPGYG